MYSSLSQVISLDALSFDYTWQCLSTAAISLLPHASVRLLPDGYLQVDRLWGCICYTQPCQYLVERRVSVAQNGEVSICGAPSAELFHIGLISASGSH